MEAFNGIIEKTKSTSVNERIYKVKFSLQPIYFSIYIASCLPWIPEQGTVGASGDLAPLAHLALGLMGEGKMWSRKSGWSDAKLVSLCLQQIFLLF